VFALYIALYGFGRTFTETMRLDYSYDVFGPIRFNAAVAMLICLVGIVALIWLLRFRPGREDVVEFAASADEGAPAAEAPTAEAEATPVAGTDEPKEAHATPEDPDAQRAGPQTP
jgi:hypothetical protein